MLLTFLQGHPNVSHLCELSPEARSTTTIFETGPVGSRMHCKESAMRHVLNTSPTLCCICHDVFPTGISRTLRGPQRLQWLQVHKTPVHAHIPVHATLTLAK